MQQAVNQLVAKRAEAKGELNYLLKRMKKLEEIIKGLDISIQVFEPDFIIDGNKSVRYRKNQQIFKNGEAKKLYLDILRKEENPLTIKEVAIKIMEVKNFNKDDLDLRKAIQAILRATFYKSDLLVVVENEERIKKWKIA